MSNVETSQFANADTFEEPAKERAGSRDYSDTAEWDASKTLPSRFQKRKGSIYATPSSRDGHVERNRDAVEEFHKAHSKRWSISSKGSSNASAEQQSPEKGQRQQSQSEQGSGGQSRRKSNV
ncbi:Uu.00g047560.m01.CDS01 [Anthostomella pinea]|uniref:Uu.00g047560.m01.CDS01 n=1 Tax=Anthostomella pinea TaxID=933095 RepID=A0AAI8YER2_9PEZI|nr:Uu.00g047560.m01.CDS01 [Anthostomella pinea]